MSTATIIYGSEASVLRDYQSRSDDYLIKIYNQTKPVETLNTSSCTIENFDKTLGAVSRDQSITKLRFVGAGFLNQSNYFIAENNHSIAVQIDTNISNLATCFNLEILNLKGCSHITGSGFRVSIFT